MDVNDTQKIASRIKEDCEMLRGIMQNERMQGKSMFYDDAYNFMAVTMRDAGTAIATAESNWWEIRGRVIKRKVAIKPLQQNETKH